MESVREQSPEGIATALYYLFVVLLFDAFFTVIAVLLLMGDHTETIPKYDYSKDYWTAFLILLIYAVGTVGLGWHWHRIHQSKARSIGLFLGISPIVALVALLLISIIRRTLSH